MSENQVLLPATTDDEKGIIDDTRIVDRFAVASRDIVPSVQVTLAKRIIRPGSNRVLCLAAHTDVPLSDDDISSVSNLALRLSDGTNVALQLSFFNENETSAFVPVNRYVYEPERYSTVHSDSRLGNVIGAILAVAVGGSFLLTKNPLQFVAAKPTPQIASAAFLSVPTTQKVVGDAKSDHSLSTKNQAQTQPRVQQSRQGDLLAKSHKSKASSGSHSANSHLAIPRGGKTHAETSQFFVPPPPPDTPTYPGSMPFFQSRWQNFTNPTTPSLKPEVSSKTAAPDKFSSSKVKDFQQTSGSESKSSASEPNEAMTVPPSSDITWRVAPAASRAGRRETSSSQEKYQQSQEKVQQPIEKQRPQTSILAPPAIAPTPGPSPSNGQSLERIVPGEEF
jgi:hypothetical protein